MECTYTLTQQYQLNRQERVSSGHATTSIQGLKGVVHNNHKSTVPASGESETRKSIMDGVNWVETAVQVAIEVVRLAVIVVVMVILHRLTLKAVVQRDNQDASKYAEVEFWNKSRSGENRVRENVSRNPEAFAVLMYPTFTNVLKEIRSSDVRFTNDDAIEYLEKRMDMLFDALQPLDVENVNIDKLREALREAIEKGLANTRRPWWKRWVRVKEG